LPTIEVLIKGKVQGVYYRKSTVQTARLLGLTGWVKNTDSGNVQAIVSGPQNKLNEFIAWCWQGPVAAKVTSVEVIKSIEVNYIDFTIKK